MLRVPIERVDGVVASSLRSVARWQELERLPPHERVEHPIRVDDLVSERHHRWYADAWYLGRIRFEFLLAQGLGPGERVLDLGCGAGRLGIWLVGHLEPGRYFGVDAHLAALVAFSAYEIPLHGLVARRPRLLLDADFRVEHFGERFDAVLDFSVTRFLPDEKFERAYARLLPTLASGARVFVGSLTPERLAHLCAEGFEVLAEARPERPRHLVRHRSPSETGVHVLRLR